MAPPPLPPGYIAVWSFEYNCFFYVNEATKETSWTPPSIPPSLPNRQPVNVTIPSVIYNPSPAPSQYSPAPASFASHTQFVQHSPTTTSPTPYTQSSFPPHINTQILKSSRVYTASPLTSSPVTYSPVGYGDEQKAPKRSSTLNTLIEADRRVSNVLFAPFRKVGSVVDKTLYGIVKGITICNQTGISISVIATMPFGTTRLVQSDDNRVLKPNEYYNFLADLGRHFTIRTDDEHVPGKAALLAWNAYAVVSPLFLVADLVACGGIFSSATLAAVKVGSSCHVIGGGLDPSAIHAGGVALHHSVFGADQIASAGHYVGTQTAATLSPAAQSWVIDGLTGISNFCGLAINGTHSIVSPQLIDYIYQCWSVIHTLHAFNLLPEDAKTSLRQMKDAASNHKRQYPNESLEVVIEKDASMLALHSMKHQQLVQPDENPSSWAVRIVPTNFKSQMHQPTSSMDAGERKWCMKMVVSSAGKTNGKFMMVKLANQMGQVY